ncbi:hypothetical protein [Ammoniphilus sp. 3BR4]|uniref:hypothetical protein n=1 Tax=Ammoniphilus sp. 3BR4 TaxID=3158265 RepID=UPI00346709D4
MICFSLLAHENEKAVLDQVENIHRFIGKNNCMIVVYNGGTDEKFGRKVCDKHDNVKLCPYSRKLEYRRIGRVLYDVMRWLEKKKAAYDFLMYFEFDTMFIKHGFKEYLNKRMVGYDWIGQNLKKLHPLVDSPTTARSMFQDWDRWQPFFEQDYFYKTSNPFQTYRSEIVRKMLKIIDGKKLELLLASSTAECLGEMIYPTLAAKCGARLRRYDEHFSKFNRFKPALSIKEIQSAVQKDGIMFVHPVKDDHVREWMMANIK